MPVFVAGRLGPFYAYRPVKKRTVAFWIMLPWSIFWILLVFAWLLAKWMWISGRWIALVAVPAMIALARDIRDWMDPPPPDIPPEPEAGPRDWSPPAE